jgi:hypothetical protein
MCCDVNFPFFKNNSLTANNAKAIAIINIDKRNILIIFITFVLTFLDDFIASKGNINRIKDKTKRNKKILK